MDAGMRNEERPREASASRGYVASPHLPIPASSHKHHVPVLVDAELLMRPADAADLRGDPRGAELFLQGGRGGLHCELLEAVLAAGLARVSTRDPLGSLAGDRGHGQRFA